MKAGMERSGSPMAHSRSSPTGQEASPADNPVIFDSPEEPGRNRDCNFFRKAMPHEKMMQLLEFVSMVIALILLSPVFLLLSCLEVFLHPKRYGDESRSRRWHESGQS